MKTKDQIFEELKQLFVEQLGFNPKTITLEASLRYDLKIWGDDGDEVFEILDRQYDVDWSGIDLWAIFGSEGSFGGEFAHLEDWTYVEQACSVNDIVEAIHSGKWQGEPVLPVSPERLKSIRRKWHKYTLIFFGIFFFLILLSKLS